MEQPLYPFPASTHPVYSPCCTCVIIQEFPIALEIGFKFLNWPLTSTLIWKHLHLCSLSCAHSACLHLPNSSWSLGILLLLLPGMSSSPVSASGNLLHSTEAHSFRKPWPALEHSLPDRLAWCSPPQACGFPARSISTPMVPAQGQHSSLLAALCPALCWPLRTKIYIESLPSGRASVLSEAALLPLPFFPRLHYTHRCPAHGADFGKLATYSKVQRQEGKPSGEKGSELGLRVSKRSRKVEKQKGLPQQKEGAKEGRRERAMSSKAGLRLRQGVGEGEVLGVQHPLGEACVHPGYAGNRGRFENRKLTWLGSGSERSTPRALTMMDRKYTD